MKKWILMISLIFVFVTFAARYEKRGNDFDSPVRLNEKGHALIWGWWARVSPVVGKGPNGEEEDVHSTGIHRADVAEWRDSTYGHTSPDSDVAVIVTAYEGND